MITADIGDIVSFYASDLGQYATHVLGKAVKTLWTPPEGKEGAVLGLGYSVPYLQQVDLNPAHTLAFAMLEEQGACPVLDGQGNASVLADSLRLPFADLAFDRIICTHAVEQSSMGVLVHEIERLLIPLGEAIVILPNRRGLWSRNENTPWGFGNAYSLKRIQQSFAQTNLMIAGVQSVLYTPPFRTAKALSWIGHPVETIGCCLPQKWAGVYVIRVIKQIYAMAQPRKIKRPQKRFALKPVPTFCNQKE